MTNARQAEDIAYHRVSKKDFASDDLKKEDSVEDSYMSTVRGILNGLLYLPETEPLRRKAELAVQVFRDFNFQSHDGFEAEARKTVNMYQEWTIENKYDLDALGIRPWIEKANTQALKVLQLVTVRIDNEAAKVKGELAAAREVTDAAIRRAYDILNALAVLQPSAELTQLITVLLAIEERAKLYYISSGGSSSSSQQGGSSSNGQNGQSEENNGSGSEQGGGSYNGGTTPQPDDDAGFGGGGGLPPSGGGEVGDDNGGSSENGGTTPQPDDDAGFGGGGEG
ncbi:MAG: hypothetical protein J6Y38_06320 [Bacteroidaceae bacterium]|nr:hypothetical protein [Bacteroidaceae bacterium]